MMPSEEKLSWFLDHMRRKLRVNSHKCYTRCTLGALTKRLHEEAHELSRVIQKGGNTDAIIAEAADVANFALMIADVCKMRRVVGDPRYEIIGGPTK